MSDDLLREGREMFVFLINEWSELTDADFKDVVELLARIDAHLAQPEAMTPKELAARVQAGERWKIADQPEAAEPDDGDYCPECDSPRPPHKEWCSSAYAAPVAAQRAEGAAVVDSAIDHLIWQVMDRQAFDQGVMLSVLRQAKRPAPASGLAELAKLGSFQVDWTDDEPAQVGIWKITGSRNDREWHLVAQGESFHAAISALRGQP